ncbi:MAG: exodeoxyribonuclease VII large subunit [Opitutaceae bacterium]|nr:exodeoxyribonuclease VII large subunit [Opitutaceae bacterium]
MAAKPEVEAAEALSVGELTGRIKDLLEGTFPALWVRGEVSNLRAQASGHCYFTLKDERAQISAVMFRGDAARSRVQLRDGQQLVAYGQVSVYEARGQYQLIVRAVVEDGAGRLQAEFERLKQQLAGEGLFAAENKVPLPAMPRTIGFITSPTGAAVQDFIRILERRGWSGHLVVLPVKVQGEGAAAEMVEMLELAQRLGVDGAAASGERKARKKKPAVPAESLFDLPLQAEEPLVPELAAPGVHFDLLVIGRGGGSLEDLWAFNEEPLVRAVAACRIPIISAVGHEIDFTLCDFAADVRAETPSAAAELISSEFLDGAGRAAVAAQRLDELATDTLERADDRLEAARNHLRLLSPTAQIEQAWLRLDDLGNQLGSALRQAVVRPREALAAARARLDRASPETRVRFESQRLLGLWKRLQAASPASVLNRGFAIVRDESGQPIARRAELAAGQAIHVEFADGAVNARAES